MDENSTEETIDKTSVASIFGTAIAIGATIGVGITIGSEVSKIALAKAKDLRKKRKSKKITK